MTNRPHRSQNSTGASGHAAFWGGGAALLMILCCAGPALIASGVAAGALAILGGWLVSPWVIGTAGVAIVLVIAGVVRRSRSGRAYDCCSPAAPAPDARQLPDPVQPRQAGSLERKGDQPSAGG